MDVRLSDDGAVYGWTEDWTRTPSPHEASAGWAHHGLAVTRAGQILSFHPERPEVLIFGPDGSLQGSFATGLFEGHGLTLVDDGTGDGGAGESVWVADPGSKMRRTEGGRYEADTSEHGAVVRFSLDGRALQRLERPPHPAYDSTHRYAPTFVAVDEVRHGGSGDVWVADGYGQSLVHRFRADGTYVATIDGSEGPAGRFNCPHAIFIDRRGPEPRLLVADRGNGRIQAYDLDGRWDRLIGADYLNSPSAFAVDGDNLVVAELFARLAVISPTDELLGYLGENGEVCAEPGWPNALDEHDNQVRTHRLESGRFNSPHGLAVDANGTLYVAEWLIGGRMIRLDPEG